MFKMKELITQMSKFELGLNVTITGIVLVFSMLILLVAILDAFGKSVQLIQNAANKKSEKSRRQILEEMAKHNPVVDEEFVLSDTGTSSEIVAVISAAVYDLYACTEKKPIIKSIKKSASRRSAWANAGIIDNTRAF